MVPLRAMRSGRNGAFVLLVALVLVIGILAMVLRIVAPMPPAAHLPGRAPLAAAGAAPLTRRMALIVLDGLRFDVGTDARRMPRLAARFRTHASAELWAEPISMTASAVTIFGTGAHAGINLAIRNETAQPSLLENLFTLARGAGLRTGTVGDGVWVALYPTSWDVVHAEPHRLAVGIDEDEPIFLSAQALQSAVPPVDVAVYHFSTPDHMAHGHGIASQAYETYIHEFDARLGDFLDRFPPEATVIVVGDHGATMAGIHGSNTDEQRRTLIVASGRGFVDGPHAFPPVDDIDLAPTIAALLGIPTPRSARGQPLVSWLDVSPETRAAMACQNLVDLARGLEAAGAPSVEPACDPTRSAEERIAASLPIARALDVRADEVDAAADRRGFSVSVFAAGTTALLSFLLFFRSGGVVTGRRRVAIALALALPFSVFVTANLEKLPGAWLTPARVALFIVFNAPLVLWIFRPIAVSRFLDRAPVIAPVLFPGVLILTETHSALIEAYVVSAILVGFVLTRGLPTGAGFARPWSGAAAPSQLVSWLPLLALAVVCIDAGNFVPPWLQQRPSIRFAVALTSFMIFALVRYLRLRPPLVEALVCMTLAGASLVLRRYASTSLGITGWVLLGLMAAVAVYRKERFFAELLAFGSYAWVSRDLEVPLFLASYMVAVGFGEAAASRVEDPRGAREEVASLDAFPGVSRVLTLSIVTFAFAWGYVQFAGIQLGLHFMHFDFAAGSFHDPSVSMARIVIALIYKYAIARGFILFGILLPLGRPMRAVVLRSLVAVYAVRATVLVGSLEAARHSFWTPVWVTSELPHVLLALVIVATAKAYALATAPTFPREAPIHADV